MQAGLAAMQNNMLGTFHGALESLARAQDARHDASERHTEQIAQRMDRSEQRTDELSDGRVTDDVIEIPE